MSLGPPAEPLSTEEIASFLNGFAAAYGLAITGVLLVVWHLSKRTEPTVRACRVFAIALALLSLNWVYRAYCPVRNEAHTYPSDFWSLALSDLTSLTIYLFVAKIYAGITGRLPRRLIVATIGLIVVEGGLRLLHNNHPTLGIEVLHYRFSLIWSVFAIYISGSAFAAVENSGMVGWSSLAYALLQVPCYVFVEQASRHEIALGSIFLLAVAKLAWILTILWECHTSAPELGRKDEDRASHAGAQLLAIALFVVGVVALGIFWFENSPVAQSSDFDRVKWGGVAGLLIAVVTIAATVAGILSMVYQKQSLKTQQAADRQEKDRSRSLVAGEFGLSSDDVGRILKKAAEDKARKERKKRPPRS